MFRMTTVLPISTFLLVVIIGTFQLNSSIQAQVYYKTLMSVGSLYGKAPVFVTKLMSYLFYNGFGVQQPYRLFQAQMHTYMGQHDLAVKLLQEHMASQDSYAQYLLGFSYMRLAELNNCMGHIGKEFCVYPVSEKGIHHSTVWTEKAYKEFQDLAEKHPETYFYKWLRDLNHDLIYGTKEFSRTDSGLLFTESAMTYGIQDNILVGDALIEDFDGDNMLDILYSTVDSFKGLTFFAGTKKKQFQNKTKEYKTDQIPGGIRLAYTDINNDGHLDISVARGGWLPHSRIPSSILINDAKGQFKDVSKESQVLVDLPTQNFVWADFNNDGLLDVFVGVENYKNMDVFFNQSQYKNYVDLAKSYESRIYINSGNNQFTESSKALNLLLDDLVVGAVAFDFNNDNYQDLYVSVFGGPNRLYKNLGPNQNWQFEELALHAGVSGPFLSFPVIAADFNNDGYEDLAVFSNDLKLEAVAKYYYLNEYQGEASHIYLNTGKETFELMENKHSAHNGFLAMGVGLEDFNCDAYLDYYVGTGTPILGSNFPNQLFLNQQGLGFKEISDTARVGNVQKGHGVVAADIDGNGSMDIFHMLGGAFYGDSYSPVLYLNQKKCERWLGIRLVGQQTNKIALGARIQVLGLGNDGRSKSVFRTLNPGSSFGSRPLTQVIALDSFKEVSKLIITWPVSGKKQIIKDFKLNQVNLIEESH